MSKKQISDGESESENFSDPKIIVKKKLFGLMLVSAVLFLLVGILLASFFTSQSVPIPEVTLKSVEESISKDVMESFAAIAEYLKAPKKYEEISTMKPHGYLLIDSTSELKSSSVVKALAGEVKLPFLRISVDDFDDSKRIKTIIKNIRRLKGAVVFFENLESWAKINVTGGLNLDQSMKVILINKLLAEVEKSKPGIIFFAPIKSMANLDPSVYRSGRFDHIINVFPAATNKIPPQIIIPNWLINLLPVLFSMSLQLILVIVSRFISGAPMQLANMNKSLHEVILNSSVKFDSVQGCDEVKEQLMQIVDFLKNPVKYEKFGAAMPRGYLLTGPPGVGKTMLAKAVAGEAGVPFLAISGAEFDEIWIGSGSSRVRGLFADARKHKKAVIFIDEIDAVASKRSGGPNQSNQVQTLNQLLVEMDGFKTGEVGKIKKAPPVVVVLAATNSPDRLDPAILRPGRFDHTLVLSPPDIEGRKKIISKLLAAIPPNKLAGDINPQSLAQITIGFTGADLANFVNRAKLIGSTDETATILTREHFNKAKDFISLGPERELVMTEDEKERTAFHEAGHAIVALATPESFPVHQATIVPHSNSLGLVLSLPDRDINHMSKNMLQAKIDMALGGFLAEEIKYGPENVSTGPSSDLKMINQLARQMVLSGFGHKTNFFQLSDQMESSELAKQNFEDDVKEILSESRIRVRKLLDVNKDAWKAIAVALIKHENLNREQLEEIFRKNLPKQ